jgi:hypothetical protein
MLPLLKIHSKDTGVPPGPSRMWPLFPRHEESSVTRIRIAGTVSALLIAMLAIASPSLGGYTVEPAVQLQNAFGARTAWTAVVTAQSGEYTDVSASRSQAKICFVPDSSAASQCAYFNDLFRSTLTYQELSDLSVVPLASGPAGAKGLVLKATGSYPTGNVHEMAIWVYDSNQDDFRLVSALQSSEERIFTDGPLDEYLVTANWQWEQGETRFGNDHLRKITAYKYVNDDGAGAYRKVLEYTTTKKYGPEDTNTIEAEISAIEAKLGHSS